MLEKIKRGGVGFCLVKLDKVYEDSTGVRGVDGIELLLGDPDYRKEHRARTWGTVIQVPIALGNRPLYPIPAGYPAYGPVRLPETDIDPPSDAIYAAPKNGYKFMHDIHQEVKIGDKVYFPWMAVFDKRNLIAKTEKKDNEVESFIFKIPYELLYCVVRDRKIIMIGGNVLVDPIFETWESILVKTYYPFKDRFGQPMLKPKNEWIQKKVAPDHKEREGIVAHVGTPLKGEINQLAPGMKVIYKPKLKSLLQIEDKKYFVLPQNQILAYAPV